jgi:adenylate cyclase
LPADTEAFLELYAKARSAYTAMHFEQALQLFEQAQQMRPDDKAVTVHLSRARQYLVQPPARRLGWGLYHDDQVPNQSGA